MNSDTYYENLYNEILKAKALQDFELGWMRSCVNQLNALIESDLFTGDKYDIDRLKIYIKSASNAQEEAKKFFEKPVQTVG